MKPLTGQPELKTAPRSGNLFPRCTYQCINLGTLNFPAEFYFGFTGNSRKPLAGHPAVPPSQALPLEGEEKRDGDL